MGERRGPYNGTVGPYVRELRARKGWSQRELGLAIGADRSYVNQIEGGTRQWPGKYIPALARALGVTEEDLARAAGRVGPPPEVPRGVSPFLPGSAQARVIELMTGMSAEGVAHVLAAAEFAAEHTAAHPGADVSTGPGPKRVAI